MKRSIAAAVAITTSLVFAGSALAQGNLDKVVKAPGPAKGKSDHKAAITPSLQPDATVVRP